jgi:hypothetical protein
MKLFLRICLAVFALTVALPTVSSAQSLSCPSGEHSSSTVIDGVTYYYCAANEGPSAPEISASASGAGLILLAGMGLIIRGRKRFQTNS